MKLEKLVGDRFRERPSDCIIDSHALMVRGGYMKYVANGIYSSCMPLKRVTRKIEQIIREEMDAIDGQEVQFPVVMPASLWQESGRYEGIGKEMARFHDRMVSAGVMFADADLMGVPFRVIVSPRNRKQNVVEIVFRDKSLSASVPMDSAEEEIMTAFIVS